MALMGLGALVRSTVYGLLLVDSRNLFLQQVN